MELGVRKVEIMIEEIEIEVMIINRGYRYGYGIDKDERWRKNGSWLFELKCFVFFCIMYLMRLLIYRNINFIIK